MTIRRRGTIGGVLAMALTMLLAACDDDPSGPGTLTLTVEGPAPLGAVVIELRGSGLRSAEPLTSGWTHLELIGSDGGTEVHRLVLIQQASGTLSAQLEVDDVGAPPPTATVVLASDGSDLPLSSLDGLQVRVRR